MPNRNEFFRRGISQISKEIEWLAEDDTLETYNTYLTGDAVEWAAENDTLVTYNTLTIVDS